MISAESFFPDCEDAFDEGLGLREFALRKVESDTSLLRLLTVS